MARLFMLFISLMISLPAVAVIDMKNGNFSDTWDDMIAPGSGFDLRVRRTFNSRSLFSGMFGFGWCSDFETYIEVTAEGNLKLTECGGGLEVHYFPKAFDQKEINRTIDQIIAGLQKKDHNLTEKYISNLKEELRTDDAKRSRMAAEVGIHSVIKEGTTFYAGGQQVENIVLKDNMYIRMLVDGTSQRFDRQGHLAVIYDKNGNYLKLNYKDGLLHEVVDNGGRKLSFHYSSPSKKIAEIDGPGGLKSTYKFKNEDLAEVNNAWKHKYTYVYDDTHNILRINFPDKTFKALTYNEDRDWVTSYTDRAGCVETYTYQFSPEDPKNHYTSKVEKKCKGEVTNWGRYEFWYKKRSDGGGEYLARVKSEGKTENVDITYHEIFGRPLSITRNGSTVNFSYFSNGQIKTKATKFQDTSFEYDRESKHISEVKSVFKDEKGKTVRTRKTQFKYDNKGNLIFAENTDGQKVWISYDTRGRISTIKDQAKKVVEISYEEKYGKPSLVSRPGVGTITVAYNSDGQIAKVDSKQGPIVAVQVASTFNNLLDVISPATNELNF